ncbi:MAG: hypothetical protein AB8U25_04045 [Rickettsiales endosymbiont of Dermacentor nuttalli]
MAKKFDSYDYNSLLQKYTIATNLQDYGEDQPAVRARTICNAIHC